MAYDARALLGGAQFRFQGVVLNVAFMRSKVRRVIGPRTVFGALEIQRAFDVIVLY